MPLKSLDKKVKVKETVKKDNSAPVVVVDGDIVMEYNKAVDEEKAAVALKGELAPALKDAALGFIFKENTVHPEAPVTTVKLTDATGEFLRFEFTSKYNAADAEQVSTVFDQFPKVDVNQHVVETLKANFDSDVFLDAAGNFNQKKYDKYRLAIERVAKEFDEESPLSCKRIVVPKPNFHLERWKAFTREQQFVVSDVLPNTMRMVPLKAG